MPHLATTLQRLAVGEQVDAVLAPIFASDRPTTGWSKVSPCASRSRPRRHRWSCRTCRIWRGRGAFEPLADGAQAPSLPFRLAFEGERKAGVGGGRPDRWTACASPTSAWLGRPLGARYLATSAPTC